jgi:glycosyltransferase involved in cell wall biosynthesis
MSKKNTRPLVKGLMTHIFLQSPDKDCLNILSRKNYVKVSNKKLPISNKNIISINWEMSSNQKDPGGHIGTRIVDELMQIENKKVMNNKIQSQKELISIVIPVLNEINTLSKLCNQLSNFNLKSLNLDCEFIFVDGGSNDGSLDFLKKQNFSKVYKLDEGEFGRGLAIRKGFSYAQGGIIVVLHSDLEYSIDDIPAIIKPILSNEFEFVIGSRLIRLNSFTKTLFKIYGNNFIRIFVSRVGGELINLSILFLYKRYISDPFSGLKGYDSNLIRNLKLECKGLDLETEIIAKARKLNRFILEVPISYVPRKFVGTNKATIYSGLKSLSVLIKHYFRK